MGHGMISGLNMLVQLMPCDGESDRFAMAWSVYRLDAFECGWSLRIRQSGAGGNPSVAAKGELAVRPVKTNDLIQHHT
jgi:hypothetical protein